MRESRLIHLSSLIWLVVVVDRGATWRHHRLRILVLHGHVDLAEHLVAHHVHHWVHASLELPGCWHNTWLHSRLLHSWSAHHTRLLHTGLLHTGLLHLHASRTRRRRSALHLLRCGRLLAVETVSGRGRRCGCSTGRARRRRRTSTKRGRLFIKRLMDEAYGATI